MWNFLFLPLPPCLSGEEREGCCIEVTSFPDTVTCLPASALHPPTTHTNLNNLTLIPPGMHLLSCFHLHKDCDQRASIVYCSSVMVWKQPSAGPFDIRGHINQGCHTAWLPSAPPTTPNPNRILSLPLYFTHSTAPIQSPDLLSLTQKCVIIISSSSDSSPEWIRSLQALESRTLHFAKRVYCQ